MSAAALPFQTDAERIAELKAVLRDIAMGADMMLQPFMCTTGSFKRYAEEVKRVATYGARL